MGFLIAGLLITALGLLYVIKPRIGAQMLYRWVLRSGSEPTKFMMISARIAGFCITLVGLFFMLLPLLIHLDETVILG